MRLCLCAATVPDRALIARTTEAAEPDRAFPARTVEEAIYAASGTGFRCLELSIEALEDYWALYPLVVLDALLAEQGCHIGVISGFALDTGSTENETGQWSLLQARFLEVCSNLDGLGGGILTLGNIAVEQHMSALQALSALAQPYDVRIALECDAAGNENRLSLGKGADLLQAVGCPNVELAYTVGEAEIPPSQRALLDEFADRVAILRCPVSGAPGIRTIVEGRRSLCSIKPPAGLHPLEAARAAADYAASIGCALTGRASPTRRT